MPPLKHVMKERLGPVPQKIHPSPHLLSFKVASLGKKKKIYIVFLKAEDQGLFEDKKEGEGQMRKKDFLGTKDQLP